MRREIEVFFFNDTATTEIYTLSLHDALPILEHEHAFTAARAAAGALGATVNVLHTAASRVGALELGFVTEGDRKSTRLNSSHANISYAVFCLKKKNNQPQYLSSPHLSLISPP